MFGALLFVVTMQETAKFDRKLLFSLRDDIVELFDFNNWTELGILTDCSSMIDNHARLLRSLNFGDQDYPGCVLEVLKRLVDVDIDNYKITANYVLSLQTGDAFNVSSVPSVKLPTVVFQPKVFDLPELEVDATLVSVMMPFEPGFSKVYDAIKGAAEAEGLNCLRADDIWEHSTVINDVFSLIFRSQIVVCDFSSRNPNVFYEAGIAHTLGKDVIPLTQNANDIPFDLRHHRYLQYLNNGEGLLELGGKLRERMSYLKPAY